MFQGDSSNGNMISASCPYSRLPVQIRPEWTDILLGGDHQMTMWWIGEQILSTQPTGFVREASTQETLIRIEEAVRVSVAAGLPFVWVADYSGMSGITMGARKLFASEISRWPRLRGLILFGLSPFYSAAVRLAIWLKLVPFPVHIVGSYQDAIKVAVSILESLPSGERPVPIPPVILTDDRWKLELDGYSIRFEVIDGSILHSLQQGRVREEHLDPIFELRDEVMLTSGLKGKPFSILAGMDNVEQSSHAGRLGYVRRMARWYRENPFDVEVFYGLNSLMGTVIKVTAGLVPFKVHVSKTYEEGLQYISGSVLAGRDRALSSGSQQQAKSRRQDGVPQEKINELLKVLGAISWDTDDELNLEAIDPSDPLALVYEAISLVKTEIDDLLARQESDAVECRRLQDRLVRSEKMEVVGLLAGGVAHDLNNILSGIVSYPELLLMDENLSPETRRRVHSIKKSGDQAAAVVKDLMAVSRGAATRTEPVSLGAVVLEYLGSPDYSAMSSKYPGVTLDSRIGEAPALVTGSPVHLRKVVANLVANAFESFEEDSKEGRVFVETFLSHVDGEQSCGSDGAPGGDSVVLRVVDNGPGIAAEHRERIFEPFFTKKIMGRSGTGLGLTVVWNIVQNHGGFIDLASGEEGTSFDIYFPVTTESLPERNEGVPLEQLRGTGQRILVVDDVAAQREIASALLVRLGYQVESVSSGEVAIERLERETFDLLLLDMLMEPGLNGRETYERILEIRPGQKVVIASGFSQDEEVRKAQALGAGAFIAKPYSLQEIGMAVQDVLEG